MQAQNAREVFFVEELHRRSIPDFDTFVRMNFSVTDIHILPPQVVAQIPIGQPLSNLWISQR